MSDYQDFCESFGGCASDPGFMDEWIGNFCSDNPKKKQNSIENVLVKGKLVQVIKLTTEPPAKVVGVIWNKKLEYDLSLKCAKQHIGKNKTDPASMLISRGYIVYSRKENNHWYQIAFKDDERTAFASKQFQAEYESVCPLLSRGRIESIV